TADTSAGAKLAPRTARGLTPGGAREGMGHYDLGLGPGSRPVPRRAIGPGVPLGRLLAGRGNAHPVRGRDARLRRPRWHRPLRRAFVLLGGLRASSPRRRPQPPLPKRTVRPLV